MTVNNQLVIVNNQLDRDSLVKCFQKLSHQSSETKRRSTKISCLYSVYQKKTKLYSNIFVNIFEEAYEFRLLNKLSKVKICFSLNKALSNIS